MPGTPQRAREWVAVNCGEQRGRRRSARGINIIHQEWQGHALQKIVHGLIIVLVVIARAPPGHNVKLHLGRSRPLNHQGQNWLMLKVYLAERLKYEHKEKRKQIHFKQTHFLCLDTTMSRRLWFLFLRRVLHLCPLSAAYQLIELVDCWVRLQGKITQIGCSAEQIGALEEKLKR